MVRPDEPLTIVRFIASPAFASTMSDALRRFAGDALLSCQSDADVNATFVSLRGRDFVAGGRFKGIAEIVGEEGAQGRAFLLELQTTDQATLTDDALRAIAVELHGILRAPIYSSRRHLPMSHWAQGRSFGWGPAGLFAQSTAPALPFGGSQSIGLAIEVGARTTIVKVKLVGANLDAAMLGGIAAAVGGGESGFADVAAYALGPRKDGSGILLLELGDCKRTPLHRVLQVIEIEAARFGARLGAGALLSDAPLQLFIGALGMHMGLEMTPAQVIETHVPASTATR
jgi:hypothetical protein